MSRRRKGQDGRTPAPSPAASRPRWSAARALGLNAALNLLAVAGLTLAFAPFDAWPLAYLALVPWVLALAIGRSTRWTLLGGTLAGGVQISARSGACGSDATSA